MESKILLIAGILIIIAVSIWIAKKKEKEEKQLQLDSLDGSDTIEDNPVAFGYKCIWFAVKTTDTDGVAAAINLKNIYRSNWKRGIKTAYDDGVFITPPVDGWTLVAGWGLPNGDSAEGLEEIKSIADRLSKYYGEAQFFGTHRVVEYHCWLKSVHGKTERLYAYLGEQGENIAVYGEPTEAEAKYKLVNTFSDEAQNDDYHSREDLDYPDEDLVLEIAGAWSINPALIEENKNSRGLGLLGTLK